MAKYEIKYGSVSKLILVGKDETYYDPPMFDTKEKAEDIKGEAIRLKVGNNPEEDMNDGHRKNLHIKYRPH